MTVDVPRARSESPARTGLLHNVLCYRDDTDYHERIARFVRDGVEQGAAVLLALGDQHLGFARDLVLDTPGVTLLDVRTVGRNPGRLLAAMHHFVQHSDGRPARVLAEPVWPGRTEAEVREVIRQEALLDLGLADHDAHVLCAVDVRQVPPEVLDELTAAHPLRADGSANPHYRSPARTLRHCAEPLTEPVAPQRIPFTVGSLGEMRATVARWAQDCGLPAERRDDLVLAVNEAATNAVLHAPGSPELLIWRAPHAVIAEIRDQGDLPTSTGDDPMVGKRLPPPQALNGRGLWLVHQLCDLVEPRFRAGRGTLRMTFHLS